MNFSKNHFALFFILVLVLFYHNVSHALENEEFVIGVEAVNYYPLINFSVNDETKESYTKEILSCFFESQKYAYRFLALPIKRFDKWYVEENIDFKFPDNPRWRTKKDDLLKIIFSKPVVELIAGSYVLRKNEMLPINDIKKLGTILGFVPTLWLDKVASGELELVEESSPIGIVKHVLYGNVDATNIDENVIRYNLAFLGKTGEIILNKKAKHEVFSYQLSTMKFPKVITEFNVFLKNNKKLIKMLKDKYGIVEGIKNK